MRSSVDGCESTIAKNTIELCHESRYLLLLVFSSHPERVCSSRAVSLIRFVIVFYVFFLFFVHATLLVGFPKIF